MSKIKEHLSNSADIYWFFIILIIAVLFIRGIVYYKEHYCKQVTYDSYCKDCLEWETIDNGRTGKFHREWIECKEWKYYDCELVKDSCGLNKLK